MDQSHRPWADLPSDIIPLILSHLPIPDHARFASSICKSFSTTARPKLTHLPYLLLSPSQPSDSWALFSPMKAHPHPLPSLPWSYVCFGLSKGYLALSCRSIDVHLFHPLSRHTIPLPDLSPVCLSSVHNPVLSSSTAFPVIVAVLNHCNALTYCRVGDKTANWSSFGKLRKYHLVRGQWYSSIIFFKGLLHCLTSNQEVLVFDFCPEPICRAVYTCPNPMSRREGGGGGGAYKQAEYLVESAGELLMVVITSDIEEPGFDCGVYRFDPDGGGSVWAEVRSLGQEVLLLGEWGCSISVHAEDVFGFGFRGNCVYFAIGKKDERLWREYCLGDGKIRVFDFDGSSCLNNQSMVRWFKLF